MVEEKKHSGNLTLLGGKCCLDFINTLDWRGKDRPVEYLNDYSDVVRWAAYVHILTPKQAKKWINQADKHKTLAKKAFVSSIELRELLYRIFISVEEGITIEKQLLNNLNRYLQKVSEGLALESLQQDFQLVADVNPANLTSLLNPLVWEAVTLLISPDRFRIKSCGDKTCGWMFLDTSKNKSRQWCDMKSCGNRAKARKFYKQKKKAAN